MNGIRIAILLVAAALVSGWLPHGAPPGPVVGCTGALDLSLGCSQPLAYGGLF